MLTRLRRCGCPVALEGVVISHPGRQHSYETALAAQQAGLLFRYLTSFYRTGRPLLPRISFAIPSALKARMEVELRRRWHPDLDPGLVETLPLAHLAFQVARRAVPRLEDVFVGVGRAADHAFDRRVARWLLQAPQPGLVHGFEGGALETLRTAHRMGCATVLDVTSRHEDYVRLYFEEAQRWGMRPQRHPAWHSQRVLQERLAADVVLVPSGATAGVLRDAGVPDERITVLPYGADPERFTPPPPGGNGRFRVLFAGHIGLRKGVIYLLQAWSRLRLPAAELLLLGDEEPHGRRILAEYRGLYRRLKWIPHTGVPGFMAESDLLVLPSLMEGSPLVVYEAMAAGLPVVTTENARAVVRDGIDGIVVPIRDPDALREAISFMYRNPEARRRMGAAGRRRIQHSFSWKHYRARLARIHTDLLATGRVANVALPDTI